MTLTTSLIREYLLKAQSICEECLPNFQMPTIVDVEITSAQSYWAQIRIVGARKYSIRVTNIINLIPDATIASNRLLSAMVHELIHTHPGCMNHQRPFQTMAARVNKKYPELNIARGITSEEVGVTLPEPEYRYYVYCQKCGQRNRYQRKPKIWKYINKKSSPYTCTVCGNDTFSDTFVSTTSI